MDSHQIGKLLKRSITTFVRKYLCSVKSKTVKRLKRERISMDTWLSALSLIRIALKNAECPSKRRTLVTTWFQFALSPKSLASSVASKLCES